MPLDPRDISIDQFDYPLPDQRIARYPLDERHHSKLLVWKEGQITDTGFSRILDYLPKQSLLVFNESSVINARLFFKNENGATIEIFCLEPEEEVSKALTAQGAVAWRCLVGGLKKWKQGRLKLQVGEVTLSAEIIEKRTEDVLINFLWTPSDLFFSEVLSRTGVLPVPPYLNRETEEIDRTRYQTVYAGEQGSVAAPTAGLHFTPAIIDALEKQGIGNIKLSLHVGSGTFKPVKAERLGGHTMHTEWLSVTRQAVNELLAALESGRKIIMVGTTSLRAIESLYWLGAKLEKDAHHSELLVHQWDPYKNAGEPVSAVAGLRAVAFYMDKNRMQSIHCRTSLLIAPPYKLKVASGLITNFHQPRSTLLLLVAAVTGDNWKKIYLHALANNYRFLSYGDSSLLFN